MGPIGAQGLPGNKGIQGESGKDGSQGPEGKQGHKGDMGSIGLKGEKVNTNQIGSYNLIFIFVQSFFNTFNIF